MKDRGFAVVFSLLLIAVSFGFGCTSAQPNANQPKPSPSEPKLTKVTKDDLKSRLAGRNVQFIEKLPEHEIEKPNPLYLSIKVVGSGADGKSPLMVTLNNEPKQGVSEVVTKLGTIFKTRADQGVFIPGKNEVDKRVNIAASQDDIAFYNKENIYIEDFEKLVDALRSGGIDQITVNFADTAMKEATLDDLAPPPPLKSKH
jgi:hypothetical protein